MTAAGEPPAPGPAADPPRRELVSAYVRRFGGWTALCRVIAHELRIAVTEVADLERGEGNPAVYVQARTQHGDFGLSLSLFIDTARTSAYPGKTSFLRRLARALNEDILYDDGAQRNPYRWVLLTPGGARFEVFEDAAQPGYVLALDRNLAPTPLLESTEDRDGYCASRAHLPRAQRSLEELEWELAQGRLGLATSLDMAQDPGPEGFARFAEWERELAAEIERRRSTPGC